MKGDELKIVLERIGSIEKELLIANTELISHQDREKNLSDDYLKGLINGREAVLTELNYYQGKIIINQNLEILKIKH